MNDLHCIPCDEGMRKLKEAIRTEVEDYIRHSGVGPAEVAALLLVEVGYAALHLPPELAADPFRWTAFAQSNMGIGITDAGKEAEGGFDRYRLAAVEFHAMKDQEPKA